MKMNVGVCNGLYDLGFGHVAMRISLVNRELPLLLLKEVAVTSQAGHSGDRNDVQYYLKLSRFHDSPIIRRRKVCANR